MTLEEIKIIISAETQGLKNELAGVKKEVSSMLSSIGKEMGGLLKTLNSINFSTLTLALSKIIEVVKKVASAAISLAKKVASAISQAINSIILSLAKVGSGLISIGKEAIEAASDLAEVQNVVDVAFGSYASEVDAFAKSAIRSLGMSETTAKQMASTFMAMGNGMDIAAESGKNMAIELTGLAGDMSSFYNVSLDVAETALKSVYTGETESLKKFGVVMTEANLQAFALSQGITKQYSALTQAEKVMLRYQYVMKTTANAQGDFARTSGSWANQVRLLKEQWTELCTIIGTKLVEAFTPVLNLINNILSSIISMANALAKTFGGTGISSITGATTAVADNMSDAASSAKAMKSALTGIDELNVISQDSGSGSGSGSGGGASTITAGEIKKTAEESSGTFADEFKKAWNDIRNYIESLPLKINEFFNFDGDEVGRTIAEYINEGLSTVHTFLTQTNFTLIGTKIGEIIRGVITPKTMGNVGQVLAAAVNGAVDFGAGFFSQEKIDQLRASIKALVVTAITKFNAEKAGVLAAALAKTATNIVQGLIDGLKADNNKNGVYDVIDKITDFITGLRESGELTNLINALKELFTLVLETALYGALEAKWGKDVADALVAGFNMDISPIYNEYSAKAAAKKAIWGDENHAVTFDEYESQEYKDYETMWRDIIGKQKSSVDIQSYTRDSKNIYTWDTTLTKPNDSSTAGDNYYQYKQKILKELNAGRVTKNAEGESIIVWSHGARNSVADLIAVINEADNSIIRIEEDTGNYYKTITNGENARKQQADYWEIMSIGAGEAGEAVYEYGVTGRQWMKEASDATELSTQKQASAWSTFGNVTGLNLQTYASNLTKADQQTFYYADGTKVKTTQASDAWKKSTESITTDVTKMNTDVSKETKTMGDNMDGSVTTTTSKTQNSFLSMRVNLENTFKLLKNNLKTPINGIIGFINSMVKAAVDGLNTMIRAINSISFEIPDSKIFGKYAGESVGFDLSEITYTSIPYLAKGGIVNSGQLFMANENGPELVGRYGNQTGVMNNDQIVSAVSTGVFNAMMEAMKNGSQAVNVFLDGKQIEASVRGTAQQRGAVIASGGVLNFAY